MAARRRKSTAKTAADKLDKFLQEEQARLRIIACQTCANELVRETVSLHLDRLQAGTTTITLSHLHKHHLVPNLNGPKSYESVKRHVRQCLCRDVTTGNPLKPTEEQ